MTDLSGDYHDPQQEPEPQAPDSTPAADQPLPPAQFEHDGDEEQHKKLLKWIDAVNIADDIDDSVLGEIGQRVCQEYEVDKNTRNDWMDKTQKAMDLAMQVSVAKTYPWPKACLSLDTDILTKDGWKPIADVNIGEFVYSRASDGVADYYPVTNTYRYKADEVVHFKAKSIDLLVTPNHNMLVETRKGGLKFIEAGHFLESKLPFKYIPLMSKWEGETPAAIHGVPAKAYMRFLGWFLAEGSAIKTKRGIGSSFVIAQSKSANPHKYELIKKDIEACGFTWRECKTADRGIVVRAKSMSLEIKKELRGLGIHYTKRMPEHVRFLSSELLVELLDTMVLGDGHTRFRPKKTPHTSYHTTSSVLASQVQELCQKVGLRGTISSYTPSGGTIRGRKIKSARVLYSVSFNRNKRIKISRMSRELLLTDEDVACVEVCPHHTIYVRRNGKAVWVGNSNIIFPLMTTAAIQFAARAYPSIISGKEVVKGVVVGDDSGIVANDPQTGQPAVNPQTGQPQWQIPPGTKHILAAKIGEHMSWQLLDEQTEWEEETDKLLHILPIVGCAFRKTYFDSSKDRNASVLVPATKVVINYGAKSIETAPRITEEIMLYPLEIEENERAKMFRDIEYSTAPDGGNDRDAPHEFLEQHRYWDLDEDDYPEPYIITVHKMTQKVVRIVARYDHNGIMFSHEDHKITKINPIHYFTKYDFLPNPDGGIYGVGFGQLLRPINEAVNTSMNMLVDAGHLAVTGGGFIGKGLSLNAGAIRFTPGEYKTVNATGATVKENIVPLSFPGPSPVLFQLLGTLIEAGKEVAAVKDVLTGEQKGDNIPATTTLALIEQGLKVFTAIYKRIHRSLKKELEKLYRLNSIYLPDNSGYRTNNEWKNISRADYAKGQGVEPVSDPNMVSDQQRLGRAQFLLGFKEDPLFNQMAIRQRVLDAANIEKPQELLVTTPPPNPEIVESAAKLELSKERGQAESLRNYAQALLYLAQADAALGDAHLGWATHQLDIIKARIEGLANAEPGSEGQSAKPPIGDNQSGLHTVPTQPGPQTATSLPAGLSGSPPEGGLGAPPANPQAGQ